MRGVIHLTVQSAHLRFDMEFSRNITILKGDSATGKTTLVDMLAEYNLNGSDTGISVSCPCPCRVVAGSTWEEQLGSIRGSLVFIDEGNRFVASEDFARVIQRTDNYYVIVTRESLANLPYSVNEIYGIHSSGRYAYQEPVYHHMYRIYSEYQLWHGDRADKMIVEDAHAGYEFFSSLAERSRLDCVSAQGAGHIFDLLQAVKAEDDVIVIADGAAFGAHMEKVYQMTVRKQGIKLYLPESFEWLLLSSDVLNDSEVRRILEHPSDYIESQDYLSWERYFTRLLTDKTQNTYLQYNKSRLNPVYLQGKICQKIIAALPEALQVLLRAGQEA